MTEKRFNCHVKFSAMPNGIMVLDYERHGDEQTVIEDISREKAHRVMDRLNELNDENEQLKQFKEDVFNKIDMHLRMLPTARDNEWNEDDGDPSLYTGAIYMLETLKKELSEND